MIPVLAIDGPSGSGKGAVGMGVAERLGWHYLDSGAVYRALGLAALWAQVPCDDEPRGAAGGALAIQERLAHAWERRHPRGRICGLGTP